MRTLTIAVMHHSDEAVDKMDKAGEGFWRPGKYPEIQQKSENCPSCRTAGKNLETQIPSTKINRLELLTEPN